MEMLFRDFDNKILNNITIYETSALENESFLAIVRCLFSRT